MPRKSRCCVGEGIRGMKPYIPSPPSRMPSVEDDAYLGIGTRAGMTAQYHTGSPALMEGAGFWDIFKKKEFDKVNFLKTKLRISISNNYLLKNSNLLH